MLAARIEPKNVLTAMPPRSHGNITNEANDRCSGIFSNEAIRDLTQIDALYHVFLSDAVLRDIGLLSRFLITEPETTMGSRPHRDLTSAHEAAMAAYRAKTLGLLRQPLPYDDRGEALKPLPLEMTPEARERWIAFSDEVDAALKPGCRLHEISGFASKIAEHAARIAAVLAVYDEPAVADLDRQGLERGIELTNYYASET
ncbi:MAG: DUF3987 domain-containing protein, partial [Rhodomicrobium sp.]